ncbi:DUF6530 family protein [Clostridium sp.]|uniref:DUF6530 family protein n=1 Tax=Clostridium sp. TaxID=1506 RepID=UPI001A509B26|nr:DUF6530 family protein [Clostridium sp.]MBK5237157.1 hypothetical protein [Clostridium sp.]
MNELNTLKVPNHLKHKPIYEINNYSLIDGPYVGASDALGLSIGLAQWNERGRMDISAKVWRHTGDQSKGYEGGKWSRQSEELPLHRALDLSIFICKIKEMRSQQLNTKEIKIQGNKVSIEKSKNNEHIVQDLSSLDKYLEENDEYIDMRLKELASTLKDLGY